VEVPILCLDFKRIRNWGSMSHFDWTNVNSANMVQLRACAQCFCVSLKKFVSGTAKNTGSPESDVSSVWSFVSIGIPNLKHGLRWNVETELFRYFPSGTRWNKATWITSSEELHC
jgi:hypothetical protein